MNATVRPMQEADLGNAEEMYRQAFRSIIKLPDRMIGDIRTRFAAEPGGAVVAELDGSLLGSCFVTRWGSLAVVGPGTIRPATWTGNAGKLMVARCLEIATRTWGCRHLAGYTLCGSPQHIDFFRRLGFWPRFLTMLLARSVGRNPAAVRPALFSGLPEAERQGCLNACRSLTGALLEGLDLEGEIQKAVTQGLGETVLLWDGSALAGMAVCQCGPGSEAGPDVCYIKFAAARPGPRAAEDFDGVVSACEALATTRGLSRVSLGMNLSHPEAYTRLLSRGYMPVMQGVALHGGNDPLYKKAGIYAIDDWR